MEIGQIYGTRWYGKESSSTDMPRNVQDQDMGSLMILQKYIGEADKR